MKNWLINKLGGVTSEEFREALQNERDRWNDREVLTAAVKDLFNTIGKEDIIREVNGQWMVGDKLVEKGMQKLLTQEAKMILDSKLWKYLQNDIKYMANQKMFEKSQSESDLLAGKLWLYTLDVVNTRLDSLKKESGRFNK